MDATALVKPTAALSIRRAALVALALWGSLALADHGTPADGATALGTVDFPISCSDRAQPEFNRAVALLHHMTYPQATLAFERVAALDPDCAMAHWGIAMTLFQPLWPTRPGRLELERGWREAQLATALEPGTELERLFVSAVEAFFREPASTDYWRRISSWEAAMAAVHATFPEHPEASAFYALSLLAVAPADRTERSLRERAAELLAAVYEANPNHPGAMHYMIHANDAPGRERLTPEIVRAYERVAPQNPHALHMPTHIYTRLGAWDAVIRGNLLAAEAALALPAGEHGEWVWDEFPHAVEYLVYAYLQRGADAEAAVQLRRMLDEPRLQPSFKTAFHLASTPARYALETHDWAAAAALEPRTPDSLDWDRFRWPEAVTWFARALGAARRGDLENVDRALARLQELEGLASGEGEDLFARNIGVLRLEAGAWLAHAREESAPSEELMRRAVELEASTPKHPVTPAPTLPALEQLGDLLLEQGRGADALEAYESSLALYPGRFNSVLGAARAARKLEQLELARSYYRQLLDLLVPGARPSIADEARVFLTPAR